MKEKRTLHLVQRVATEKNHFAKYCLSKQCQRHNVKSASVEEEEKDRSAVGEPKEGNLHVHLHQIKTKTLLV